MSAKEVDQVYDALSNAIRTVVYDSDTVITNNDTVHGTVKFAVEVMKNTNIPFVMFVAYLTVYADMHGIEVKK